VLKESGRYWLLLLVRRGQNDTLTRKAGYFRNGSEAVRRSHKLQRQLRVGCCHWGGNFGATGPGPGQVRTFPPGLMQWRSADYIACLTMSERQKVLAEAS
jgi:hypothetical protein